MSDFLGRLAARSLELAPVVAPRLPSLFEPVGAGITPSPSPAVVSIPSPAVIPSEAEGSPRPSSRPLSSWQFGEEIPPLRLRRSATPAPVGMTSARDGEAGRGSEARRGGQAGRGGEVGPSSLVGGIAEASLLGRGLHSGAPSAAPAPAATTAPASHHRPPAVIPSEAEGSPRPTSPGAEPPNHPPAVAVLREEGVAQRRNEKSRGVQPPVLPAAAQVLRSAQDDRGGGPATVGAGASLGRIGGSGPDPTSPPPLAPPRLPRFPQLAALASAARRSEPAPRVEVTIGRIEVRATPTPSAAPARRAAGSTATSLEDYLRRRDGRQR